MVGTQRQAAARAWRRVGPGLLLRPKSRARLEADFATYARWGSTPSGSRASPRATCCSTWPTSSASSSSPALAAAIVGTLGRLGRRGRASRARVPARPAAPPAQPPERVGLAECERRAPARASRARLSWNRPRARLAEANPFERHRAEERSLGPDRRQDARAVRLRASPLLARQSRARWCVWFCDRGGVGRRAAANRESARDVLAGAALANRSGLALSREHPAVCRALSLPAGTDGALRRAQQPRSHRPQCASVRVRVQARDVRGLRPQQVRVDRSHPVDAQQRLARAHVAALRLLPATRGRLLRHQEGLCEPLHVPVFL